MEEIRSGSKAQIDAAKKIDNEQIDALKKTNDELKKTSDELKKATKDIDELKKANSAMNTRIQDLEKTCEYLKIRGYITKMYHKNDSPVCIVLCVNMHLHHRFSKRQNNFWMKMRRQHHHLFGIMQIKMQMLSKALKK